MRPGKKTCASGVGGGDGQRFDPKSPLRIRPGDRMSLSFPSYFGPPGDWAANSLGSGLSERSWSHRMLTTHQRLPSFSN